VFFDNDVYPAIFAYQ